MPKPPDDIKPKFDGKRNRYPHGKYRNIVLISCKVCFSTEKLERHRIIPKGSYEIENVICLCRKHHGKIHKWMKRYPNMSIDELIEQIILHAEV